MFTFSNVAVRLPAVALMLASLLVPLVAPAQELPSYAQPVTVSTDETIHGRIASVDGAFNIRVDDDRGFVDNVELHQGTIINPTGLSLAPGMSVTIAGYNAGSVFNANEIDTPYSYSGSLPTPVYYGSGYWCPGFAYGYGPSFSLAIIFGGFYDGDHNRYHYEHRPYYGRPWDGRRYFGSYVGHPNGGRELTGSRRITEAQPARDRRAEPTDFHGAYGRAPSAFAGRSFAGPAYAGAPGRIAAHSGLGEPRAFAGTHYGPATGAARYAPVAGGFAHVGRVGGGFARGGSAGGGGARIGGAGMHGGARGRR